MRSGKHLTRCLGIVNIQEMVVINDMCKCKVAFSSQSIFQEKNYFIFESWQNLSPLGNPQFLYLGQPISIWGSQIRLKCSQSMLSLDASRGHLVQKEQKPAKLQHSFGCSVGRVDWGSGGYFQEDSHQDKSLLTDEMCLNKFWWLSVTMVTEQLVYVT